MNALSKLVRIVACCEYSGEVATISVNALIRQNDARANLVDSRCFSMAVVQSLVLGQQ